MLKNFPVIALVAITVACSPSVKAPASTGTTFVDPEGKPVTIAALPVKRIVSTSQAATEWIVLLGGADRMVARTDFDRQPELASLPSIGGGLDPSAEVVAALHPDVVIGWRIASSTNLLKALAPFHIPVVALETTDTADVFLNLRRVGILLGKEREADSLRANLLAELKAIESSGCPNGVANAPTVLLEVGTDPPQTAGRTTWLNTILGVACLRNLFADLDVPWSPVSLEAIASRNPDWILTSKGKAPGARLAELRAKSGWRDLEAVKKGHILEIPGDLFARGGPSIAEAARAIVAARKAIEEH